MKHTIQSAIMNNIVIELLHLFEFWFKEHLSDICEGIPLLHVLLSPLKAP